VSSFEEWFVLEVDAGQTFLGVIHSLQVTLCLVSEEWPMVGNSPGSTIRDSHSLGQTHSLQVTLCLVLEEWPRVRNGPNIS
jgi:hypothetical protein